MVRRQVGRRFDSRRSCFALVQSNTSIGVRRRGVGKSPIRLEFQAAFITGVCLIYNTTLSVRTPYGLAFEDERVEGRAIVRTYIRSRRACDRFASTRVFLAVWRRRAGNVTGSYQFIITLTFLGSIYILSIEIISLRYRTSIFIELLFIYI